MIETQTLRPELQAFAELQEQVLQANDWKGGWRDKVWRMSYRDVLLRIDQELKELEDVFAPHTQRHLLDEEFEQAKKEAADVANFCMMLVDLICNR